MLFMMIIRTLIRCPAMLIFAMVMSFRINHDISLIFLAVIPILGVGLYLIIKHVHPVFERVFKTYDRLNGVVQENLSGIRVVKNFVRVTTRSKSLIPPPAPFIRIFHLPSASWPSTPH